jgi:hypothetical protein
MRSDAVTVPETTHARAHAATHVSPLTREFLRRPLTFVSTALTSALTFPDSCRRPPPGGACRRLHPGRAGFDAPGAALTPGGLPCPRPSSCPRCSTRPWTGSGSRSTTPTSSGSTARCWAPPRCCYCAGPASFSPTTPQASPSTSSTCPAHSASVDAWTPGRTGPGRPPPAAHRPSRRPGCPSRTTRTRPSHPRAEGLEDSAGDRAFRAADRRPAARLRQQRHRHPRRHPMTAHRSLQDLLATPTRAHVLTQHALRATHVFNPTHVLANHPTLRYTLAGFPHGKPAGRSLFLAMARGGWLSRMPDGVIAPRSPTVLTSPFGPPQGLQSPWGREQRSAPTVMFSR